MPRIFWDEDADLRILQKRRIAVVGYGNQGRAQALNLRDGGYDVCVGNRSDNYFRRAREDGFEPLPIADACAWGEVIVLLIPDEAQPEVFVRDVAPSLMPGDSVVFAAGYNLHYAFVAPPPSVDVLMVAPRMLGEGVRSRFLDGTGFPSFLSVEQDATGEAWHLALAFARAIGSTRAGVLESSAREETLIDLLYEQGVWAGILGLVTAAFELLVEHGCSAEAVLIDFYLSGELEEIARSMREVGFLEQIDGHSPTSRYGQLSRLARVASPTVQGELATILGEIVDGRFAREWAEEQATGAPRYEELRRWAREHPLTAAEGRWRGRSTAA